MDYQNHAFGPGAAQRKPIPSRPGGNSMPQKIILSADSTCDIGPELKARYQVHFFNYHIQIGDESYVDGVR